MPILNIYTRRERRTGVICILFFEIGEKKKRKYYVSSTDFSCRDVLVRFFVFSRSVYEPTF